MDEREEAIERVYLARYAGFRRAAAAVLGDFDAAHDAVQDGFARALVERRQFRGGSLEAWIWRIVLRKALDLRRRRRQSVQPIEHDFDPGLVESNGDPALAEAIRALPPRRRLIVFLRYFADLDYTEIAQATGVSTGTVAATLAQANACLARELIHEGVADAQRSA